MDYIYSIHLKDERDNSGRIGGFIEATGDAAAITEVQAISSWANTYSGAAIKSISLKEVFSSTLPDLKDSPNEGCEIEYGGNLRFKVDNRNPRKTAGIRIPSQKKSDFSAKGKIMTPAAKTAWKAVLISASGATAFFSDSNFDRLSLLIGGYEKWIPVK
jgi:hypothetical protein